MKHKITEILNQEKTVTLKDELISYASSFAYGLFFVLFFI